MKVDHRINLLLASIILGAAIGAVTYYTAALKYRSIGVLSLDATLAEYKRFTDVLANKTSLIKFVSQSSASEQARDAVTLVTNQADPLREAFTPVFRVSKSDLKELGEPPREPKDPKEAELANKQVLGARLTITHRDPAIAREGVVLLANYTRQELLRYQLAENISQRLIKLRADIPKLENEAIAERFNIQQMQAKVVELQKIADAYPKAQVYEARQVVNIERGGEKFLSPIAQVIAAESEAVQNRRTLAEKERELKMAALELQYLAAAQEPLASEVGGSALAGKLADLATRMLKPAADKEEWARVVFNQSMMDIDTARRPCSLL